MKYFCSSCSYSYDEGLGDIHEGIKPGTKIFSIDICPGCGEFDSFEGVEEEVNYIDSEDNLDFIEVEHCPIIDISGDKLKVFVGLNGHPMGDDHRITTISLYDEYEDLVFEEFLSVDDDSTVEFDIGDIDDFEIRIKCSLHGVWGRKFKR